MRQYQNLSNIRQSGEQTVTTTPIPLTQIVASSANTTFTDTSVVDGSAWTLSDVHVGEMAISSDGYIGLINSVDDGNDTVGVKWWVDPRGKKGGRGSGVKPTDTSTVSIQRVSWSRLLTITAGAGNNAVVYVGRDGNARATDYPLQAGESLPMEEPGGIDITNVYVLAASGSQTVAWILGTVSPGNFASNISASTWVVTWGGMADGDATPDVSDNPAYYTQNTAATTITDFDGVTNGSVFVLILDNNTTIQHNSNIKLQGGIDYGPGASNDVLFFVCRSNVWYEVSRSPNS